MKPGDLARLRDCGTASGQIVIILRVEPRHFDGKVAWTTVDYIRGTSIFRGCDTHFLEPVQVPLDYGMIGL